MFKASSDTAELVVQAQDKRVRHRHLDVTSRRGPEPDEPFNLERAREAIGERLVQLLGTIARRRATADPSCQKVLVLTGDGQFIPEVERDLGEHLALDAPSASAHKALQSLARDFLTWAREHPAERQEYGMELEGAHRVFTRCPDLRPALGSFD